MLETQTHDYETTEGLPAFVRIAYRKGAPDGAEPEWIVVEYRSRDDDYDDDGELSRHVITRHPDGGWTRTPDGLRAGSAHQLMPEVVYEGLLIERHIGPDMPDGYHPA